MKTEREVREKIDSLMNTHDTSMCDKETKEQICCQIDVLLWIIGDESGASLLDERIEF